MKALNLSLRWCWRRAAALALSCTVVAGATVAKSDPDEPLSVTVNYADLDLTASPGVQVLYRRLKGAANTVCAPLYDRHPRRMRTWRDCQEQALANAVASIDVPMLTAMHSGKKTQRTARG